MYTQGYTPLHAAAAMGQVTVLSDLLDFGANVSIVDQKIIETFSADDVIDLTLFLSDFMRKLYGFDRDKFPTSHRFPIIVLYAKHIVILDSNNYQLWYNNWWEGNFHKMSPGLGHLLGICKWSVEWDYISKLE